MVACHLRDITPGDIRLANRVAFGSRLLPAEAERTSATRFSVAGIGPCVMQALPMQDMSWNAAGRQHLLHGGRLTHSGVGAMAEPSVDGHQRQDHGRRRPVT